MIALISCDYLNTPTNTPTRRNQTVKWTTVHSLSLKSCLTEPMWSCSTLVHPATSTTLKTPTRSSSLFRSARDTLLQTRDTSYIISVLSDTPSR